VQLFAGKEFGSWGGGGGGRKRGEKFLKKKKKKGRYNYKGKI